ncbi:MAG: M42 family metallopeptidase [Candidatus Heimdallarchaeota archaeon]|nr:M42 family metallopeptidase [Candidatus Heimdallarchaeota archaeon]
MTTQKQDVELDVELLEKLCNAFGPSGHEKEIQRIVRNYGQNYCTSVEYDRLGSVIFKKVGMDQGPKIFLAGHSDEIGFVITGIEKNGFLTFHQLGGWPDQSLLAHQVLIRPFKGGEKIIGIIAAKPPHILTPEERNKVVKKENMHIDIGCSSEKEVKDLGIRIGDPAVRYAFFRTMIRQKKIDKDDKDADAKTKTVTLAASKAFDDRIGVFIILEVLRRLSVDNINHPNTVYCVSTTQEEVGLRGARTSAQKILPDVGFAIDVDISGDVPGTKGLVQKMGKGVCISAGDGSMIPNPRLRKFAIETAEDKKITFQPAFLKIGGTDAGIIHLTGMGAPSLFLGIATRHIHSHNGILDLADVENCIQLLVEMIQKLDWNTVESFTRI